MNYKLTAREDLLLVEVNSVSKNGVPVTSELIRHKADAKAINDSSSRYLLFSNNR